MVPTLPCAGSALICPEYSLGVGMLLLGLRPGVVTQCTKV